MVWDIAGIMVLTLLKILGILLLLLLVLLFLVLFVPIRYRVRAVLGEEYEVHASISWLWFLIRFPLSWQDGQIQWKLRILGIPFFRSKTDGSHGPGKKCREQGNKGKEDILPEVKAEGGSQAETETVSTEKEEPGSGQPETVSTEKEEPGSGQPETVSTEKEEPGSSQPETVSTEKEVPDSGGQPEAETETGYRGKTENSARAGYKQQEDVKNKKKHKQKREFLLKRLWHNICDRYRTICDAIRNIRRKVHSVQDLIHLLQEDSSRRFICIVKGNVLQLWKHVKPQKIQADIRFGTGDPCSTGQILGGIAVCYSWLGKGMQITPDFEEACFEGWIRGKGRIRIITAVIILVRLIRNKDFRKLRKDLKQWKEDF